MLYNNGAWFQGGLLTARIISSPIYEGQFVCRRFVQRTNRHRENTERQGEPRRKEAFNFSSPNFEYKHVRTGDVTPAPVPPPLPELATEEWLNSLGLENSRVTDSPVASSHGGECCGIQHIYDFGQYPSEGRIRSLKNHISGTGQVSANRLYEVVLIDSQLDRRGYRGLTWQKVLEVYGFELVTRFWNGNSGNWCNVFHLVRTDRG